MDAVKKYHIREELLENTYSESDLQYIMDRYKDNGIGENLDLQFGKYAKNRRKYLAIMIAVIEQLARKSVVEKVKKMYPSDTHDNIKVIKH